GLRRGEEEVPRAGDDDQLSMGTDARASAVRDVPAVRRQPRRLLVEQLSGCIRRSFQNQSARRLLLLGAQVSADAAGGNFRTRMEFRAAVIRGWAGGVLRAASRFRQRREVRVRVA